MTPYWIAALVVWSGVMIYATPGAWAAAVHKSERRGDPMRLACWLVGLIMVAGTLRWFLAADNASLWKAVYVVAIVTGAYILRLMRAYGRGTIVDQGRSDG